jgi:hypothetical protein
MTSLTLSILNDRLAVCRLDPGTPVDLAALRGELWSITSTADELSLVLPEVLLHPGWQYEASWRALKVEGPLDFSLVGILAKLSSALADAGVSLFALSTYDTDYILVKEHDLPAAVEALEHTGCRVVGSPPRGE